MGTRPTVAADNVYCKARLAAAKHNDKLLSRAGAAELLGVSQYAISDYELGNVKVVPVDKVALMADLYNAPEIKNYYCKECCPLGCSNPDVIIDDLDRISIKAMSSFKKIAGAREMLLNIVEDGVISEDEKTDVDSLLSIMEEVESAIQSFKIWHTKNNK